MEKFHAETIPLEQIYVDERIRMHLEKMPCRNGVEKEDADTVLWESLKLNGMMDPIKVRAMTKHKFLLLDGWKRLKFHKALFPNIPIRAQVKVSEAFQSDGIDDKVTEQDLCDAATYNLVREKVPVRIVEGIVSQLYGKEWGYERIARAIGYTKAGVQKIVNRLKNSDSENKKDPAVKVSIREIKRTRTMLQKLSKSLGLTDESDKELFRHIDEFLKTHEELLQEGLAKENPPAQDASEESAAQETSEEQ